MKKTFGTVIKIIGWLVLLAAFASIGFATDNPTLMVPVYFLVFLGIFGLVLIYNMKRQRRTTTNPVYLQTAKKIIGAILVLIGLLMPYFFFRGIGFTAAIYLLLIFLTIVFVVLTVLAIRLINQDNTLKTIGGYVLLVVICSMPAILMMQHDKSYNALGSAYYAALLVSILTWTGLSMVVPPKETANK